KVYAILADYRAGHPNILPKAYFKSLVVEQGGQGAGTVIHVQLSVMGIRRESHMRVSEPEPGRVLAETDLQTGLVTTFIVDPAPGGQSTLRISTDWESAPGLAGWLDRTFTPLVLRHIYTLTLRTVNDTLQLR
ncbi:MAG TPA: SRPBCC family protein, partial [Anaerolineae bacterium]